MHRVGRKVKLNMFKTKHKLVLASRSVPPLLKKKLLGAPMWRYTCSGRPYKSVETVRKNYQWRVKNCDFAYHWQVRTIYEPRRKPCGKSLRRVCLSWSPKWRYSGNFWSLRARLGYPDQLTVPICPPVISSRSRKRDVSYEGFLSRLYPKFITNHWPAYRMLEKVNSTRGRNTGLWTLICMRQHRPITKLAVHIQLWYKRRHTRCTVLYYNARWYFARYVRPRLDRSCEVQH